MRADPQRACRVEATLKLIRPRRFFHERIVIGSMDLKTVKHSLKLCCGMLLLVTAGSAKASSSNVTGGGNASYFVSPVGTDSNTGTLDAPFQTIMRAVRQAQASDTIFVRAGTYYESIIFDHGGTPGNPISLRNYPAETAVVDGSMEVRGWTPVGGSGVWQATFTHRPGIRTTGDLEDVAPESSCPDNFQYSSDRRAYLYVDDTPDASHWLKPVCVIGASPEYAAASLPAGTFGTDVLPPPLAAGHYYSGTTDTVYVRLADNGNPNDHRIRIAAFNKGIHFRGDSLAQVHFVNVSGLSLRLAQTAVLLSSSYPHLSGDILLDQLDVSLNNGRSMESDFCATNLQITNSHIHDIEYEAIHLEADNSRVENNLIEHTIAPWSLYASIGINVLGANNLIAHNSIHAMYRSQLRKGGFGVFLEDWYNGNSDIGCRSESNQNNLIEKNRIYDNDGAGIYSPGGDSNTFQNNLIYQNKENGISIVMGGTDGGPSGTQRNAYDNKVFFNTIYVNSGVGVWLDAGAVSTTLRNNVAYQNAATNWITTLAINTAQDHNLTLDPLFVNPAGGDYHLKEGSPAIDHAIAVGVIDDFDGIPRPQGLGFDMGAFEYILLPFQSWLPLILR
jgi:parallel beta-helix repeat protein